MFISQISQNINRFCQLETFDLTLDIHVISTQFERNDLLNVLYVIELVSKMKTDEFQIIKVVYTFLN